MVKTITFAITKGLETWKTLDGSLDPIGSSFVRYHKWLKKSLDRIYQSLSNNIIKTDGSHMIKIRIYLFLD